MITEEQYFMILKLYNRLGNPFFKKTKILTKEEFCEFLGISTTNSNTYNKIINLLNDCIKIYDYLNNKKKLEIKIDKLDDFIRATNYFKLTDKFIFVSTHGVAETGI